MDGVNRWWIRWVEFGITRLLILNMVRPSPPDMANYEMSWI